MTLVKQPISRANCIKILGKYCEKKKLKLPVLEAQEVKGAGQTVPEMVTSMLWHPAPLCSAWATCQWGTEPYWTVRGNVQPKLNPYVPNFPMKLLKCLSSSLRGGLFTGRVTHELTVQIYEIRWGFRIRKEPANLLQRCVQEHLVHLS